MFSYFANPHRFLRFAKIASPVFATIATLSLIIGLWFGLIASPADEVQGESVRIMYVHVPAAWSALMAYTALTIASFFSFVWRHPLADIAARACARPGMAFTFLALVTGSLWGKTTWGTWWVWDGRLTSVLVLFFIYAAYLRLYDIIPDKKQAARLTSIFAMVGFINIPIIKFSVEWWNSLHQPATISNIGAPGLPPEILTPLMIMTLCYTALFAWLVITDIRANIHKMQMQRETPAQGATISVETL